MVVQQNLELDLKSSKADVLLLFLFLPSPLSANMSGYNAIITKVVILAPSCWE